jgi:hypothetical protein
VLTEEFISDAIEDGGKFPPQFCLFVFPEEKIAAEIPASLDAYQIEE